MATRRMRIKAVINVSRGGPKVESSQEQSQTARPPEVPSSPAPVSPAPVFSTDSGGDTAHSPGMPPRISTPPVSIPPSSPHSPSPSSSSWQTHLQRPSPSKSPCLPPSGSILRRSPSPALARLTSSPGPLSPVKSPVPCYASPLSPVKHISRAPIVMERPDRSYPTSPSPGAITMDTCLKSPPSYVFRPPPSPSPSGHHDFPSHKSPVGVSRPSPAQSPVFGVSRSVSSSTSASMNFLPHHFNTNSNSGDSHEVAALMSANTNNVSSSYPYPTSPSVSSFFPHSPEKRFSGRDSGLSDGSENTFPTGHSVFTNVSNNIISSPSPSPSFSKTIFDNPEPLKKRAEDTRKKEAAHPNGTKFATARKEFYDKLQSGQLPEKNKLTMLHFTFYNPPNPNKPKPGERKPRSRASSICSDVSAVSKQEPEFHPPSNNENMGKALSAPSSIAGSRRTTASSVGSGGSFPASEGGHSEAGSVASNASSGASVPGPRVKVGPDGQLILDETSLVVETSESQRARQQIKDMEVVSGAEYAVGSSGFYRYKKSYRRGNEWTERETVRFYRALNQCGTDFSMMLKVFPYRTRQELKSKFKREDKRNPDLISKALQSCVFDPDEGISSEEEPEKDPVTGMLKNKKTEVEVVVCASDEVATVGKRKKKQKKPEIQFSTEQVQEMKVNLTKGPGTGKGRKWNTPVEGLVGGKLPPKAVKIKVEQPSQPQPSSLPAPPDSLTTAAKKPRKKYTRKKKQPAEGEGGVVNSAGANPTSQSAQPAPPLPGTVSIIMASGVLPPPPPIFEKAVAGGIKKEKPDSSMSSKGESKNAQNKTATELASNTDNAGSKRRSRLPKTKPNVKGVGRGVGGKSMEAETVNDSSQPNATKGVCDELFRFDPSDPAGLKVVPAPLLLVEETVLEGNEEGSEDLVVVDLDELNSIQSDIAAANSTSAPETPKSATGKRKRKNSVGTVRFATSRKDPYGIPDGQEPGPSCSHQESQSSESGASSSSDSSSKRMKPLPFRIPGPGGSQPQSQSPSSSELNLEINLNES